MFEESGQQKRNEALRAAIGQINFSANRETQGRDLRRVVLGALKLGRNPKKLAQSVLGMAEALGQEEEMLSGWREPEELDLGGDFDVCDLRVWLELAKRAGVPFIEARPLISLSDNQLEAILPQVALPEAVLKKLDAALEGARRELGSGDGAPAMSEQDGDTILHKPIPAEMAAGFRAAMEEVLFEVPSSWMVRTHLAGSSLLKSLVGTGLMEKGDDVARIAQGVSLGAGWFQSGNHRLIDFADDRFLKMAAGGHKPVTHYLARPWHKPARFHEGEDLHRANSPLAGPGKWPAEWRVFIRNGVVTGVANYYGWTGQGATPENCWNAIEAAALGQKIADTARKLGLVGRYVPLEKLRGRETERADIRAAFAGIDPDGLHCTLDFLEGEDGLILLEGGAGHLLPGGAHPCAFAGQGVDRSDPARLVSRCEGVAVLPMKHVHLAEPSSWVAGEVDGCILDWEEANLLAHEFGPLSESAEVFLAERAGSADILPTPLIRPLRRPRRHAGGG